MYRLNSNWLDGAESLKVPIWSSIRRLLQDRGLFSDAIPLLLREPMSKNKDAKPEGKIEHFEEFIAQASIEPPPTAYEQCQMATVWIGYGEKLREMSLDDHAINCVGMGLKLIDKAKEGQRGDIDWNFPRHRLLVDRFILRMSPPNDPDTPAKLSELAKIGFRKGNYHFYRQTINQALVATEPFLNNPKIDGGVLKKLKADLSQEIDALVSFENTISGSAIHLYTAATHYVTWRRMETGSFTEDDFELMKSIIDKYPAFDLPSRRWNLLRNLVGAAADLQMSDVQSQYSKMLIDIRKECPITSGPIAGLQLSEMDDLTAQIMWNIDSKMLDDLADLVESLATTCFTFIVRWLRWDFESKYISVKEAKEILRWDEYILKYPEPVDDKPAAVETPMPQGSSITATTSNTTRSQVAGPQAYSESQDFSERISNAVTPTAYKGFYFGELRPRETQDWETWISLMEKWLSHEGRRPSHLQRLLVLRHIQLARRQHTFKYAAAALEEKTWAMSVYSSESQRMLDLVRRLSKVDPRLVTEEVLDDAERDVANSVSIPFIKSPCFNFSYEL